MRDDKLHSQRYWALTFGLLVAAFVAAILAWSMFVPKNSGSGLSVPLGTERAEAYATVYAWCREWNPAHVNYNHWWFWKPKLGRWIETYWGCSPKGRRTWVRVGDFGVAPIG